MGDECGTIAFTSQVEIICIPPHQLAPGETQAKIVVKSLTEAVTGAEVLIIGIVVAGIGILVGGMLEGVRIRPYNNS